MLMIMLHTAYSFIDLVNRSVEHLDNGQTNLY